MKQKISTLFTIVLFTCFICSAKAQLTTKKDTYPYWRKRIDSVFMKSAGPYKILADSIGIYPLNLSLQVTKNSKTQKTKVTELSVSDHMIYKLFTSYKKLYSIDYSSAMGKRKRLNILISILISNTSPNARSKYTRKTDAVVDVESTTDSFEKSLFFISKLSNKSPDDLVVFMPYIIRIVDVP